MYEQSLAVAKKMIDWQRTGFEGMIGNAIIFWDQMGNASNTFLSQASWIPDEGKKALREWINSYKKGCETLRDAVNNGYASLENYFEKKV